MKNLNLKKYKKIVFNDFSKQTTNENFENHLASTVSYNVNCNKKTIDCGLGINDMRLPINPNELNTMLEIDYSNLNIQKIEKIFYIKKYFPNGSGTVHRILMYADDKKLYLNQLFSDLPNFFWLYDLTFESAPVCHAYKIVGVDSIVLCDKEKMVVWKTNQLPVDMEEVPIITSMCTSNGKLWATVAGEASTIWLCMENNPEIIGWDTPHAMQIKIEDERGDSRKILTFKENLYVFRDYGITRINYYTPENIVLNHIYLSDSMIYPDTVSVCGDVIMFMTRNGLYAFDGIKVEKFNVGIENLFDGTNSKALGSSLQNKYYLAVRLNFNDGKKMLCEEGNYINNALIIIDTFDHSYEMIRGVDISCMLPLKTELVEKMLVCLNCYPQNRIGEIDNSGKYFGQVLPMSYATNTILADNMDKIVVRKIRLHSSKDVEIKFTTDEEKSFVFTTTKNGLNEIETMIECKNFKLEFNSKNTICNIKHLEIDYFKN